MDLLFLEMMVSLWLMIHGQTMITVSFIKSTTIYTARALSISLLIISIFSGFYEKVVEYKRYGIKVSLAIGGWNDSAGDKYSKLVNDPAARARFVSHVVLFLEKYGFDGLDLDWEYPKCWQVRWKSCFVHSQFLKL